MWVNTPTQYNRDLIDCITVGVVTMKPDNLFLNFAVTCFKKMLIYIFRGGE